MYNNESYKSEISICDDKFKKIDLPNTVPNIKTTFINIFHFPSHFLIANYLRSLDLKITIKPRSYILYSIHSYIWYKTINFLKFNSSGYAPRCLYRPSLI